MLVKRYLESNKKIYFNIPFLCGNEILYIKEVIDSKKTSGNGIFTNRCHLFLEKRYGFKKVFLTHSCTDALEMAAILINIKPGDEVIIPSYTFVSTANAFVMHGAKIIFTDCEFNRPNIDAKTIKELITEKTKAIAITHYAGIACDMNIIMTLAEKYNLFVIEDCAHSIDSYYKSYSLGSIGNLGVFSFHETKNVISGEGGMLSINDNRLINRAEIIWEKGTNQGAFLRREVDMYSWVDVGSSFQPSEITAAFLFAQLEQLDKIQTKRINLWNTYYKRLRLLEQKELLLLPYIPSYATNNGHIFYVVCRSSSERINFINFLRDKGIAARTHYLPLHKSPYYYDKHNGKELKNAERYSDCLVRLPLYYGLMPSQVEFICDCVYEFLE